MAKKKKKNKAQDAGPDSSGEVSTSELLDNQLPPEIEQQLGTAVCVATLADSSLPSYQTGEQRLWLPPEAMHSCRLSGGQPVAVCVTRSVAAQAGAATPPGTPTAPFVRPASVPQLDSVVATSLWAVLATACGKDLQPHEERAIGCYAAAATVWPAPRLARGAAAASPGLAEQLGMPLPGVLLAVHELPAPPAAGADAAEQPCAQLMLQFVEDADSGSVEGDDGSGGAALRPVALLPVPPAAPSLSAALTPSTPPSTPSRGTPGPLRRAVAARGSAAQGAAQWLASMLQPDAAPRREMLQLLLRRHLAGRRLLAGAPVLLPLLGQRLLLQVSGWQACGTPALPPSTSQLCLPPRITQQTQVVLAGTGERVGADGLSAQRGGPAAVAAAAAAQAASDAVGGGLQGPAAHAAAAAAAAGARSSCEGYSAVGGMRSLVEALGQLVVLPLTRPHLFDAYGIRPPRGVLLHGPPGTGKTLLCRAVAYESGASLFVLNGPDVISQYAGESEAGIKGVFAAARAAAPSIIFIDELDALAPARGGAFGGTLEAGGGGSAARVVTTLLTQMDGAGGFGAGDGVVVLAATNRADAIEAALRRPGRFDRELLVGPPSPADREDILRRKLAGVQHVLTDAQVAELAAGAHAFVGADLAALVAEAAMAALRRAVAAAGAATVDPTSKQLTLTIDDVRVAETAVRPSAMREVAVEVPAVGWQDVGGLAEVKQRLQEAVTWPQQHAAALARVGASAPKGVLLYGPPGCSKTLLARAVAGESRVNFLAVKGPELFSKYVGQSEKAVQQLFARARGVAPSIVFFDELDGLASTRSADGAEEGGGSSVAQRVLSQLLMEMDGLQGREGVVVLAATNRPDAIDPALLRPGRFDRLVLVPPPDTAGRREILAVHTRRTPLAGDVDLQALAERSDGCTGADLMALCREAALAALDEDVGAAYVSARHFDAALVGLHRSLPVSGEAMQRYGAFQRAAQFAG